MDLLNLLESLVVRDLSDRGAFRRACEDLRGADRVRVRGAAQVSGDELAATGVLCAALASANRTILLPPDDEGVRAIADLLGLDRGVRFQHAPVCDGFLLEVDSSKAGMVASTIAMGPNAGEVDSQIQVGAARTLWAAVAVAAGVIVLTSTTVQARTAYALDDVFIDKAYELAKEERNHESQMADRSVLEIARFVLRLDTLAPLGPTI